jgi:transposase-like protein
MTCNKCNAESLNKFGKDRKGHQRFRCPKCGKTFTEPHNGNFADMYTPTEKATAIIKLLVEGVSVRSIERLTDTHRDTILRVLVNAGDAASDC